jgi:hypothetical protein
LQRAGHEFPSDGGAAVVQMREPGARGNFAPPPPQGRNGAGGGSGLESELARALNRAARRDHEQPMSTPPGWEPIFMAQELSPKPAPAANPRARPVPAAPQKRTSSGARNILAISLSAAVVGIALQQIGTQWNDGRDVSATEPETSTAALLYAGTRTSESRSAYGVEPREADAKPLDMRPSLTEDAPSLDTGTLKERDDFMKEIEEASNILRSKDAAQKRKDGSSVTPVVAPIARGSGTTDLEPSAISGTEEQAMLRRARELMERGHITGARLIFEHLALQQSALGAFALAQTYDEKFLGTFFVKGLQPDQKLAAKWYRRAAELVGDTPDRR